MVPPLLLAPAELGDRRASELVIVRWVARNIDVESPDPSECPDPFAWTLLRQCREVPGFVVFFTEKLWAKLIPSRSQLDQVAPKAFDGQAQLDLISRIEAIRDAALGKKPRVELLSGLEPEERVSAFEEFDQTEEEA